VAVLAVACRDEARAETFAQDHAAPKVHSSYEALLADPDVHAVYIGTPNGLHVKWAVAALKAGKHVLCEKPIASIAQEAREVIAAAEDNNRLLMEASHSFHHPANIRAREIVRSGELGDLETATSVFTIPLSSCRRATFATRPKAPSPSWPGAP
jgi:predicted dehydrogenase